MESVHTPTPHAHQPVEDRKKKIRDRCSHVVLTPPWLRVAPQELMKERNDLVLPLGLLEVETCEFLKSSFPQAIIEEEITRIAG